MGAAIPFRGPGVWHHPAGYLAFCVVVCAFLAFISMALEPADWLLIVALCTLPALTSWVCCLRPRLVLLQEEVVVVDVLLTTRYQLRDVVRAEPTGFGTTFWLVSGDVFVAPTLWRPNYLGWLGRTGRAHKVAAIVLARAAELRGDPAPEPLRQARGTGEITIPWSLLD